MPHGYLHTYLNDHLAAATAGEQLFRRVARNHRGSAHERELTNLSVAITEDVRRLRALAERLGVSENKPKQFVTRAAELVGRLKPNRNVVRRSGLSDLMEVESLRVAVTAKRAGWRSLIVSTAASDDTIRRELTELLQRAEEQIGILEELHQTVAAATLGHHD